jgi:hypothetical protein
MNPTEIEEALRGLGQAQFEVSEFVYRLCEIYGAPKSTVTKLRQEFQADLLGTGPVEWKKRLLFRMAAKGESTALVDSMVAGLPAKNKPRFVMATDGLELYVRDTKDGESRLTPVDLIHSVFDFLLPLAGMERYVGVSESDADAKAAKRLARLYDEILSKNPSWAKESRTHDLNLFITRLLFCFFAEDTAIFEGGQFSECVMNRTNENGSDVALVIGNLFKAMSLPDKARSGVPEYALAFPYVNGGLFEKETPVPEFSKLSRRLIKECGELGWAEINPDIFGSMVQAIVDPAMRGQLGMHYTSVPNIMKVLHPLFLVSLEEEFEAGRDNKAKLNKLLQRIYKIRIFDPAAGSGNFLVIAYKELRKLEHRILLRLRELGESSRQWELASSSSGIPLSNFYGIELADFNVETAKLALWIAAFQMDAVYKAEFGSRPAALPLQASGQIHQGNALAVNWLDVCPNDGSETYIVGNPPYLGSSQQDDDDKRDMTRVFSSVTDNYKNLDFVAAWYLKAADYGRKVNSQAAFVATNSICQGEQVAMLWPLIFERGCEISFAHQSFKWRNNAADVAGVTCVIVGIRNKSSSKKLLYTGDLGKTVKNIGPYLLDMDDTIVNKATYSINGLPKMEKGNMPTDDGNLILSTEEKVELIDSHPDAARFVKKYFGSTEFINGSDRWCLWITDEEVSYAMEIKPIANRIKAVGEFRKKSEAPSTRDYAKYPHRFRQIQDYGSDAVLVPIHFSEDREYLTLGFADGKSTILSNACFAIYGAEPWVMALMSSKLHAAWIGAICGRIRNDIRYSNTMGYNTFPLPDLSQAQKDALEEHTWAIINAREMHPGKSIAWLYNPETMPDNLLNAHKDLDLTLETIYLGRAFKNDTERLEHLFKRYATLTQSPIEQAAKSRKKH